MQYLLAAILFLLLLSVTDPFMLLMPAPLAMAALILAAAASAALAGLVLTEGAADEREAMNRSISGRAAYLAGLLALTLGVLVEGLAAHHVDPWLAGALALMVGTKVIMRARTDANN